MGMRSKLEIQHIGLHLAKTKGPQLGGVMLEKLPYAQKAVRLTKSYQNG
jgi:hypothetical protein